MGVFLDESTPLGIFRKLLVGSEGTLAFISEGVFGPFRMMNLATGKDYQPVIFLLEELTRQAGEAESLFAGRHC